jgi:FkbM family methyltransferase
MKILYGFNNYVDVTKFFSEGDMLSIPPGDVVRSHITGKDPDIGIQKHIIILYDNKHYIIESTHGCYGNVSDLTQPLCNEEVEALLKTIHNSLIFNYDNSELPEQLMAVRFIKPTDTVLELGANIGRNTCVISRMLNDSNRLVTLETSKEIAESLYKARDDNKMSFNIVNAGLSRNRLIQKGWDTVIWKQDTIPDGWKEVNTITWNGLLSNFQYKFKFNVLVADCEGALYYICQDESDFFSNFERIIMENDYRQEEHKQYIDKELKRQGFVCIYREVGGWAPCYNCFFETWERKT